MYRSYPKRHACKSLPLLSRQVGNEILFFFSHSVLPEFGARTNRTTIPPATTPVCFSHARTRRGGFFPPPMPFRKKNRAFLTPSFPSLPFPPAWPFASLQRLLQASVGGWGAALAKARTHPLSFFFPFLRSSGCETCDEAFYPSSFLFLFLLLCAY